MRFHANEIRLSRAAKLLLISNSVPTKKKKVTKVWIFYTETWKKELD